MEPAPGRTLHVDERYAFAHDHGHTWASVEGIRLGDDDVESAYAEIMERMQATSARRCSWWLTEHSTPDDLEERLLACGAIRVESDYLHAGMLLTREPPAVDGIEVRQVTTLAAFGEARLLSLEAFADPRMQPPTDEEVAEEWAYRVDPLFAAYVDGRMAATGGVVVTRAGGYLMGGSTAPWARGRGAYRALVRARWDAAGGTALAVGAGPMSRPILERLGFEQVVQFRRIESVRSDDGD